MVRESANIQKIEKRLEALRGASDHSEYLNDLELLADLYLREDSYEPALEYLEEILSDAHELSILPKDRVRLQMKVVDCLLKRSNCVAPERVPSIMGWV